MDLISVRLATLEDLPRVDDFYNRVIDNQPANGPGPKWTKGVYPTVGEFEDAIKDNSLYLAFAEETLVGSVILNRHADDVYFTHSFPSDIAQEETMVVHLLAIGAECRGKGYARAMMDFCVKEAESQGAKALRLDVMEGNTPAFGLYESYGFVSAGIATLYYEDTGWADFTLYELVL